MKKNKSVNMALQMLFIVLISLTIGFIFGKRNISNGEIKRESLNPGEITELRQYLGDKPEFELTIMGAFQSKLSNLELDNMDIKYYEFDATIDNGWSVIKSHYTGVKLNDILDKMKIPESGCREIRFEGKNRTSITYNLDEIKDYMYIVFYRDGELVNREQPLMLLNVDRDYSYSLNQLVNIFIPNNIENQ